MDGWAVWIVSSMDAQDSDSNGKKRVGDSAQHQMQPMRRSPQNQQATQFYRQWLVSSKSFPGKSKTDRQR